MSSKLNKLVVITSFPLHTGVGRYNESLYLAIEDMAKWIYIKINKGKGSNIENLLPAHQIKSIFDFVPDKFASKLNMYFQKELFSRKLKNIASDFENIHYTDPRIIPIRTINSVVTIHDLTSLQSKNILDIDSKVINKNLSIYKKFANVIVNSNYIKNQAENYGFDGKISVIHLSASPQFHKLRNRVEIRKKLGIPLDKFAILSISTKAPRKNLSIINDVKEKLGEKFVLIRVGSPLQNAINFQNVNDTILNMLYNSADFLLFPSSDEGFGYPVVEAFATGLPVVALDIPVMNEIVSNYGILVQNELKDLLRGVRECINGIEEYRRLSLLRSEYFSFQRFQKDVSRYYFKLID